MHSRQSYLESQRRLLPVSEHGQYRPISSGVSHAYGNDDGHCCSCGVCTLVCIALAAGAFGVSQYASRTHERSQLLSANKRLAMLNHHATSAKHTDAAAGVSSTRQETTRNDMAKPYTPNKTRGWKTTGVTTSTAVSTLSKDTVDTSTFRPLESLPLDTHVYDMNLTLDSVPPSAPIAPSNCSATHHLRIRDGSTRDNKVHPNAREDGGCHLTNEWWDESCFSCALPNHVPIWLSTKLACRYAQTSRRDQCTDCDAVRDAVHTPLKSTHDLSTHTTTNTSNATSVSSKRDSEPHAQLHAMCISRQQLEVLWVRVCKSSGTLPIIGPHGWLVCR